MKRMAAEYDGQAPKAQPKTTTKPKANGTKRKRNIKDEDDEPAIKKAEVEEDEKPEVNGGGEIIEEAGGDSSEN